MAQFNSLEKFGLVFIAVVLLYLIYKLCKFIYIFALGPALNKVDFKSKGKWALVTGSTDGIGKQYARELAARGCDIILVSRSLDKLKATAEEIEKDFKVATKIIQADFGETDIYENIAREIADMEIGTLVNNVGISYDYPEYFLDMESQMCTTSEKITNINMLSVTKMTALVMPGMVKREKGVVINIGSASSIIPSPLLTVYAASKAYVDKFTEGLHMEYGKKGIIVQCVLPGFVCSNMSGIRRSTFLAPTAKDFVRSSIKLVGTRARTTGYVPHALFVNVLNFIYSTSNSFGVWLVTRNMENTRLRALKKYKKQ